MRNFLFLFVLLSMQCTTPTPKTLSVKKYFDITSFTEELIKNQSLNQSPVLIKSMVNGLEEETKLRVTDSLFWATELFPLLNAEINKLSLLDAYAVQENLNDGSSNLLKTVYSLLPNTDSKVKKIEIKYLNDIKEVRQISATIATNSPVYTTKQIIRVWLNNYNGRLKIDSLLVKGYNKTIMLDSMKYSSMVVAK